MSYRFIAAAMMGAFLLPAAANAQGRVAIPDVELYATVTGKWVLDPRRCKDIREDIRDARKTTSRRDRREDRRDQRVANCPPSSYDFIPDAGQGPKYPVRVSRGRVSRKFRGKPLFINGDTIGSDGLPIETPGQIYAPVGVETYTPRPIFRTPRAPSIFDRPGLTITPRIPQPTYQQPTVQQPAYQQPSYQQPVVQQPTYQQPVTPTYQQPAYQQPAPTYQAPAAAPSQASNYEIRNGVIFFLD